MKSGILAVGYLLALSGVYGAFTLYLYRSAVAQAQDRFEQTARMVAAELDAFVAGGDERLRTVSRLPGLTYGLQTIQEDRGRGYIPPWTTLHYLFFKSPAFSGGVFLLDRSGRTLWTEPPGLPWHGQMLAGIAPVEDIYRERSGVVSGVIASDRLLARPHVVIGVPIQDDGGMVQGVLAGVIDLSGSELARILAAVSTSDGRFVEVVDQNGLVLAGTRPPRLFAPAEPFLPGDETVLLASAPLSRAPWRIVAGQPASLGLSGVRQFQNALWGIGVALLLAATAVAAPILNGFVRSIKQLTEAAAAVSRGDLTHPIAVGDRHDELAMLARSFERMRVDLGRSQRALEQRLEERDELIRLLVRTNDELRAAQTRLIETERFAAIGELSAAVAHGIRNPLAGIKAAAHVARLDVDDHHSLQESISDIIGEADKLEARIKTLLDFSKPFEPRLAPCRIDAIAAAAVESLHRQVAARGIDLQVEVDPGMPELMADCAQLEQVLLALLSNALEATPSGGRISFTAARAGDDRVRLEIADTGPGIPEDQQRKIFDLFFTTKSSGTGFGLAVAKKIVENHRGTIAVASEPGRGARFTIEIPIGAV
ncbi:MAG: two-component system, NtrC family, sensor histidine kinase AtoS [Candidatus Binatota bacterium]|nr:two-component system, NtrC family, sensor histidine kinase AtoS [Candidatus Binatota bacterium]